MKPNKELCMQAIIIDQKLKSLVASERKITHEILLLIQTLDMTKSFRELGYSSLFEYLTKEIGYSEGSAKRRISSARLMKQVPQIANDLKLGNLNLTQVSLAQVAIRQQEKARSQNHIQDPPQSPCPKKSPTPSQKVTLQQKIEILEKLKSKSTFETQKILKDNLPAFEIPKPKATPAEKDQVHVTLQFSEGDWEKVQALMAHFSHTVPNQKIESLLLYWQAQVEKKKQKQIEKVQNDKKLTADATDSQNTTSEYLKSSDILPPLRLWKENGSSSKIQKSSLSPVAFRKQFRSHIPTAIQVQLRHHANDRCEHVSQITGVRCQSKYFLEIEHRLPVSKGGTNDSKNLRLFCRSHNSLAAKQHGILKF